jgi:hypothetical protein
MAVAILVGAVIALVTDAADSQLYGIYVQGYGMLLPDQQQFENGLVQEYNGIRLFSNPVVYPHWTTGPKGERKLVYVVTGQYWDGRQQIKDGKAVAEWVPRCVITQIPYKPRIGITDGGTTAATEFPSVREFLYALHRNYGVSYRYAWWALHPVLMWIVGCALLIGGIWPTLINLLAYGSLTRPREVKPVSLWNIRRPKAAPEKPSISFAPAPTDPDDEVSPPSSEPVEAEEPGPAEVQPLAGGPLELVPDGPKEQRAYGADQGDFYPTERHAPQRKPGH